MFKESLEKRVEILSKKKRYFGIKDKGVIMS